MSLKNILVDCAIEMGVNLNQSAERLLLVNRVNRAARELYGNGDLVFSLREQLFDVDFSEKQISLPYYIGELRGVRKESETKRKLVGMSPRYFYGQWAQPGLQWRLKNPSKIAMELTNASALTVSIPEAEETDIIVTISGSTSTAYQIAESVTIEAGELEATTENSFTASPGFNNIVKNRVTDNDVTVSDASGNDISVIPNRALEPYYSVVQVTDRDNVSSAGCSCYELLYKARFTDFYADSDAFPAPGYDDAIVWMVLAHWFSGKEGMENKALGFKAQAEQLLVKREKDANAGVEREMQKAPNRFYSTMNKIRSSVHGVYGNYRSNFR